MAIALSNMHPGRVDLSDLANWPGGSIRDVVTGIPNSGTPLQQAWARQHDALTQSIIRKAAIEYSGSGDNAVNNQPLDGIEAITNRPTAYPDPDVLSVCRGHVGSQWHDPSSDQNHIVPAISSTLIDACIGRCSAPNGHIPALYILSSVGDIRRVVGFKDLTSAPVIESPFTTMTLPSASSDKTAIHSDGSALYVAWIRTADDHAMVSKFQVNPYASSPLWTYDSGGPVTGGMNEYCKFTEADATRIAMSLPLTVLGRFGVAIINKSTGAGVTGYGTDSVADARPIRNGRIVSDGDHIFWIGNGAWGTGGSNDTVIHSASIADPTTSAYAAPTVDSVDYDTDMQAIPSGIVAAGKDILISTADGRIYKFDKFLQQVSLAMTVSNFSEKPDLVTYSSALGWDEMNMWFVSVCANANLEAAKLPGGMFNRTFNVSYPGESYQANKVGFSDSSSATLDGDAELGRMLFDGKSMWLVHRTDGIYRITAPGMR